MKRLVLILVAVLTAGAPLAQGGASSEEARITLRHEILRLINKDRRAHGLRPVALDPQASTLADTYCAVQIENGTTGHFTTDGYTPYMRYSFFGGNDGVSENAVAWSATYSFTDRAVYEMARRSQKAMMAERAPNDGHRRTILDPHATHVGIGLSWEKGEFRIAQEFIRRYITWTKPLARAASLSEPISGSARPAPGYHVEAISVYHEPLPQPMPAHVANKFEDYRLPERRRDYLPRAHRTETFAVHDDGSFNFNLPLPDGPGVYTIVVWVAKDGDRTPIAASNVSIRADRPVQSYGAGFAASR